MTTTEELIARTRKLGIHLWVSGGKLNFRAPRDAISAELKAELSAHKASLIDALSGPHFERAPEVRAIEVPEAHVLIWNQAMAGLVAYANLTNMLCRFRFPIDLQALERGLDRLVRRYDVLRCRLLDDAPGYRLVFDCTPGLTTIDLSGRDLSEVDGALLEAAQQIAWKPFTTNECLFRPFAFNLPSSETAIGLVIHHNLVDGFSFSKIFVNWMMEYEWQLGQQPDEDPADCLQYSDFLRGLTDWTKTANFQRRIGYWRETLRGAVPSRLPPDRVVDLDARSAHRGQAFQIEPERVKRLTELSASLQVTLGDVLLAGVVIALQRERKLSDICLRHLWHGRDDPRLLDMIGQTLIPIILRVRASPESRLSDVAREVHRVVLEATANHVPGHYVETILRESDATALVQTNFRMIESADDPSGENTSGLPPAEPINVWTPHGWFATPDFLQAHDINMFVTRDSVRVHIAYLESVYDDETILRFIRRFEQALEQ